MVCTFKVLWPSVCLNCATKTIKDYNVKMHKRDVAFLSRTVKHIKWSCKEGEKGDKLSSEKTLLSYDWHAKKFDGVQNEHCDSNSRLNHNLKYQKGSYNIIASLLASRVIYIQINVYM